ncbi:very-short-patch-repair endonuclease [Microbacterium endophyticum]|uniref:Very-short-patch-repair endonuclease n=1 Tax=Microbacterium endophyticum TaxID=1526412 RepID=A0A7W4V3C3_9MICO|nr:type IV toxin-antitoxin system AbiEi family antitoxin domain-containing protein [Microbacterium endophyticum]MBB2976056.1 very-short-patch-repair endonuclease [Microbacterium endophyticum]NIK35025.1 very-short-patch-repair endonuclease [Microbacterium endophyticum]
MLNDPIEACLRAGGVARTRTLRRAGVARFFFEEAVREGSLIRPRRGIYALPDTPAPILHALSHRAMLACSSAAHQFGLWMLEEDSPESPHVWAHPDRQTTRPLACTCNCHREHPVGRFTLTTVSALQCLVQIASCCGPETFLCALESARRRGVLSSAELIELRRLVPRPVRVLVDFSRSDADSGLETLVRYRLHLLGIECLTQMRLPGVGIVDLIVGDRLIIEADGSTHEGPARHRDRMRDAAALALGFVTVRLDTAMIVHDWPSAEAAILSALQLGLHESPFGVRVRAAV